MREHAAFAPEDDFIRDPVGELQKLGEINGDRLKHLLEGLAFAQRVMLPDHPKSLFVPAFLREAAYAMKHRAAMKWIDPKWRIKFDQLDRELDSLSQA